LVVDSARDGHRGDVEQIRREIHDAPRRDTTTTTSG